MRILKSLFIVCAIAGMAQAGLTDGLNAYWPMDGDVNDAAGGFAGNASAVADNGTVMGGVTFGAGKFGQAGIFDGENGSFVDVADSVDLSKGGQDLTVAAWFRVDAFDKGWQALLGKGEGSNYRVARQGGDTNFMAYAAGAADLRGGPDVNDGGWHHFVGTTAEGGLTQMFIDGVLVEDLSTRAPGAVASIVNERSTDPPTLRIGDNAGAVNRNWEGGIDELAIWNRVLTAGEIAALQTSTVPEPGSLSLLLLGALGVLKIRRRK